MTVAAPPQDRASSPPAEGLSGKVSVYSGSGVLLIALALAAAIYFVQAGRSPEMAVMRTGVMFGAILAAVAASYFFSQGRAARPATAGLLILATITVLLLAVYFFRIAWYVFFPADFLTWSEGEFVNDLIKLSVGYPLYSPQVNNDSFVYAPASQLLTFALGWLVGHAYSIPVLRTIQVVYTITAAFLALACSLRLSALSGSSTGRSWLWRCFGFALLLLIATNTITNPFVHNLHGDALAQLVTIAAYYLLLRYVESGRATVLAAMTLIAPIGFLVKQSLLIWAGLIALVLAICGRSWARLLVFLAATGAVCAGTLGLCYAIWGRDFFYWTWYVLGKAAVSPLRSFHHMLDTWTYFAGGLLGGIAVLQGRYSRPLLGLWLVWLAIIATETYTSGIAWMMNHIGPGTLIAGVWFLAGLNRLWEAAEARTKATAQDWVNASAVTACIALVLNGMGLVRIPLRPISEDAYRYVRDIEAQFQGQDARNILLDAGSWVYVKDRVVMGDRGPAIGDRAYSGIGDFSGILSRINAKRYSKILVRGFHAPDFIYDYYLWPKSSGIRQALLDNYRESGTIEAASAPAAVPNWAEDPYYFGEITILEPKAAGL
ncbi:MAG: hypothetical protein JO307_11525 [Bryobacterales bacterium]|nr:hypothetical protein [Bryobacterales bacterium]MBV9398754.1 hypothetical protein [Bryobacterales bacterium]